MKTYRCRMSESSALPRKPIDAKFTVLLWWIPILRLSASWAKPCTSRPPQTSSFRLASRHLRLRVPECRDALRCSRQFCSVYVLKGAQDDHRLRVLQCFTLQNFKHRFRPCFLVIWQNMVTTFCNHFSAQGSARSLDEGRLGRLLADMEACSAVSWCQ